MAGIGAGKKAPDCPRLSGVASIETAAADPDNWRDDAARRKLKREVIKLITLFSRREMLVHMVIDRGDLFGLSAGDLLKLAQVKFGIEAADLADLSFNVLGRLYDFVGLRAYWERPFGEPAR